jgi:hypothetical protein
MGAAMVEMVEMGAAMVEMVEMGVTADAGIMVAYK